MSEETRADKARDFIGKGHPGGEQQGEETQESCSAAWLAMLGFMVVLDGHAVSPLDLSRALPVGGGLLVPCSLSGSSVIKQLMQMVTMGPGQGGRLQSVCFPQQFPPARWGIAAPLVQAPWDSSGSFLHTSPTPEW